MRRLWLWLGLLGFGCICATSLLFSMKPVDPEATTDPPLEIPTPPFSEDNPSEPSRRPPMPRHYYDGRF